MADNWHAVAYGKFTSGVWLGEIATCGFSGAALDTGGFPIAAINEALPTFAAVPTGSTSTSTHMNWTFGSSGVGGWTEANQKALGEAIWTWLDSLKSRLPTTFSWTEVRVSAQDGTTVVNGASVGTIVTPIAGTNGAQTLPPQTAAVGSFVTGGRGPRNRGRVYIPMTAQTLGTDAVWPNTVISNVNTSNRNLVIAVNAITGLRMAVVSRVHSTYSDITAVRCGDEIDTQRRRRNGRREIYTQVAI